MITVGDVMNMRAFDSIWLATPCDGAAAREVTGVGTLDHEPFTGGYEVFTQGEFVFTTLGFAGVHPDLAEEALLALIDCGVAAVAVKPVVLKELPPTVVQASAARGVPVRFIELMPIGECAHWPEERFIENSKVLSAVPELEPAGASGVARLYALPDAKGKVGLISPLSAHFCPECNRLRITPDGRLKPCLHSAQEIELRGFHGAELDAKLMEGICAKPMRHHLSAVSPSESLRGMSRIGG